MNKLPTAFLDETFNDNIKRLMMYYEYVSQSIIPYYVKKDWYLSYRFLENMGLEDLMEEEYTPSLSKKVIQGFDKYRYRCKQSLIKTYPERKNIFDEIFTCYKSRLYSSVVALSYATAEGLVHKDFNQGLWGSKNKIKNFDKLKSEFDIKGVFNTYQKRFAETGEINKNSYDVSHKLQSNNRHLVLHGHSYKFGTRENAVRAILILDFVSNVKFERTFNQKVYNGKEKQN